MSQPLIDTLVNDLKPAPKVRHFGLWRWLLSGFVIMLMLAWLMLGNRLLAGDPTLHLFSLLKVGPFVLGLMGFGLLARDAMIPGRKVSAWAGGLLVAAGLGVIGFIITGLVMQGLESVTTWLAMKCVISIPLLSLPGLVMLWGYARRGAATRPVLAGACLGALGGMSAAVVYGMSCRIDQPAFVGIWYVTGIAIAVIIGALAGHRLLRW